MDGSEDVLKHDSLEDFHVIINDRQVFYPGEKIKGAVKLSSTKVLHARKLFVKICGQAYVKWTESKQLEPTEFVNCENYLNENRVLLESGVNDNEFETLLPGNNEFPYTFVIPPCHLPSSFYHGWHEKDYAVIRYWISASLCLNNNDQFTVTREFYLKEATDLSKTLDLQEPQTVSAEDYIAWCCFKSGPVRTNMEINRSAYHPGEEILITTSINNTLSLFNTGQVEVQLVQRVDYIANCDYTGGNISREDSLQKEHWSTEKNLLLSASVASRRKINWDNVRLKIPKAIVPTISCSKCIQLSYFIQLRVSFRLPEECILRIPIIVICKPRQKSSEETGT